MSDEYTPTTDQVRKEWVTRRRWSYGGMLLAGGEFDRWLAAHDAEVREQAARDIEALIPEFSEGFAARVRESALLDAAAIARTQR